MRRGSDRGGIGDGEGQRGEGESWLTSKMETSCGHKKRCMAAFLIYLWWVSARVGVILLG